jgi:peptidoglycan/LPS O-acetylase OafA/YrhL
MDKRIEFAHLLRGVAAGSVVLSHLAYLVWRKPDVISDLMAYPALVRIVEAAQFPAVTDFGLPFFWGRFGVALFFLISGFVIPFSISSLSRTGFATARAFRIWPTYLAGLAIALGCIAANSILSDIAFPFSPTEILINALIVPCWPTSTRSIAGIVWTLEVELFFYGLCILIMNRLRRFDRGIFLWALLVVPWAFFVGSQGEMLQGIGRPIYPLAYWASAMTVYVTFMLCGTAFYYHYRGRLGRIETVAVLALLLSGFVASVRLGVLAAQGWSLPIAYLIAFAVFASAYVARDSLMFLPQGWRRPIRWTADISYPLYAVHGVLGYTILVHAIEAGVALWMAAAVALLVVIGVAALVHKLIELPSQSCGKRLALEMASSKHGWRRWLRVQPASLQTKSYALLRD